MINCRESEIVKCGWKVVYRISSTTEESDLYFYLWNVTDGKYPTITILKSYQESVLKSYRLIQ